MSNSLPERRIFPLLLATAFLIVLFVAALAPNAGALPAQTNCPYGVCPAPSMGNSNLGWEALLLILIVIAVILAALILRNRGRRQSTQPPEEWEAPAGAATSAPVLSTATVGASGAVVAPYVEQPDDVSSPPPTVTVVPGAVGAAAVVGADAGEADIDSLMQELDKISGEILQRGTPAKKGEPPASGSDDSADKST